MKRPLPGTVAVDGKEFLYFEAQDEEHFTDVFFNFREYGGGELPQSGGAVEQGAIIHLPDGRHMFGVSYHGDLEGWRKDIESICEALGLEMGRIEGRAIRLSSGEKIALEDCRIELD